MFAIIALVTLAAIIYLYFKWRYGYWKRIGIPYLNPTVPLGNLRNFSIGKQTLLFYQYFKYLKVSYGGVFVMTEPVFIPIDKQIIKAILVDDSHIFLEKPFYYNERSQPISAILFFIGGEKWKILRKKLTPLFTASKIKMMLDTVLNCRVALLQHLEKVVCNNEEIDIKEVSAKFTTDVIGSVIFGIKCNNFEGLSEFRLHGEQVFKTTIFQTIKNAFQFAFKDVSLILGLLPFPTSVADFFTKITKESIENRDKNGVIKNDLLQLMINIKNRGELDEKALDIDNKISENELIAQAFVFFLAGFETSATTITFCLFELAKNSGIQNAVRKEIQIMLEKNNGKITYEGLEAMEYTTQVIAETLRLYPPVASIIRKCSNDYHIPNSRNILFKGTSILIPTIGLHRDPDFFPEPCIFNPDRFSKENVSKIKPFSYLPFGEGPRMCLGQRLGIMQVKVGLVTLIRNYQYSLSEKTNQQVEFDSGFILAPRGEVFLKITKI